MISARGSSIDTGELHCSVVSRDEPVANVLQSDADEKDIKVSVLETPVVLSSPSALFGTTSGAKADPRLTPGRGSSGDTSWGV